MDPLWNSLLVGGFKDGKRCVIRPIRVLDHVLNVFLDSFLGYVDLLGTTYSASTLATGYGAYIAQPLLRKSVEGNEDTLTEEEAIKIIETCMKVLFYRDARSLNKVCLHFCVPTYSTHRCLILPSVPNRYSNSKGRVNLRVSLS